LPEENPKYKKHFTKQGGSMGKKMLMRLMVAGLFALLTGFVPAGWAQTKPAAGDKPANNLEIIHEKLKADKKLIVSKYMELTESEAKNFWPVYDEYQKDLQKIHDRMGSLLKSYAAEYRGQSLTDEKAKTLLDDWLTLEQDDAKRRKAYVPKILKALPAKKAARYLQIENEYRMLLNYDLAATVDRFHGTYPPNINEGTHPISVKGPTQYQVVPVVF
jgi:hypothetical protein